MNKFQAGDVVRSKDSGYENTVKNVKTHYCEGIRYDGAPAVDYKSGMWDLESNLELVSRKQKSYGEIVKALRKAAGLPPFAAGDVVVCVNDSGSSGFLIGNEYMVSRYDEKDRKTDGGSILVDYDSNGRPNGWGANNFILVSPAKKADVLPVTNYRYAKGDFVRLEGRVAFIDDIDTDDEALPYLVTYLSGDDGEWCHEDELTPWTPMVGDRVEWIRDKRQIIGTVTKLVSGDDICLVVWGSEPPPNEEWGFDDLRPSFAEDSTEFARGDIVEVVANRIVCVPIGSQAIVKESFGNKLNILVYRKDEDDIIFQFATRIDIRHAA